MPDEPTLGEVVRQLAAITSQLDKITQRLDTDYIRKDVYAAQMQSMAEKIDVLTERADKADAQRAADRRLIITAFVAPIITALIVLYVSTQAGGR
jgi:hypothetical protein